MDDTQNPTKNPIKDPAKDLGDVLPETRSEISELSLGAWLKEQRQKRNISLEEIAAVTKIHIAQLKHLEEDQKERLPAAAFVRGFLVSYARHLNLDEEEVVLRYRRSLGDHSAVDEGSGSRVMRAARSNSQPKVRVVSNPSFAPSAASKDLDAGGANIFSVRNIAIAVVVLAVVVGLGALVAIGKRSKKPAAKAESALVGAPIAAPGAVAVPPLNPPAAAVPALPAPHAVVPTKTDDKDIVPARGTKTTPAETATKKYQLEIRALEQSWVNFRPDDENSQGLLLKAGSTTSVQADRRVILSLSDAGAVEIRFNGIWYAAPGYRGDVKSFTLPGDLSLLTPRAAKPVHKRAAPVATPPAAATPPPAAAAPSAE